MTSMFKRSIVGVSIVTVALLTSIASRAQTAATSTTSTAATTSPDVQQSLEEILEEPESADAYRYDPQGRRDPFRSLIGPTPKIDTGSRPEGLGKPSMVALGYTSRPDQLGDLL